MLETSSSSDQTPVTLLTVCLLRVRDRPKCPQNPKFKRDESNPTAKTILVSDPCAEIKRQPSTQLKKAKPNPNGGRYVNTPKTTRKETRRHESNIHMQSRAARMKRTKPRQYRRSKPKTRGVAEKKNRYQGNQRAIMRKLEKR
jgi:hypothetical protein